MHRSVSLLLNLAHAIDHLFLLIFATAVVAIAKDFGLARWEDLMPYGAGAFLLFGLGSMPAGKLGDQWGRRPMMLVFFFGMGASALLVALTQSAWQLAAALTVMGAFSSIYHPVGVPMLVQHTEKPGAAIGLNGLAGNLGIAAAAILTGFLVANAGWRAAFVIPGLGCIAVGLLFWWVVPRENAPAAQRRRVAVVELAPADLARVLLVTTIASATTSITFNLTTNGNSQMLSERLSGWLIDPSTLGLLLGVVYAVAALTQVVVGRLIDRYPLRRLWLAMVLAQVPMLALAAQATGWWAWLALLGTMACIFASIPFIDTSMVRFVDDRMRSRVAGVRLAISLGISSTAVALLGPAVKAAGFATLFAAMAGVALCTAAVLLLLPREPAAAARTP